MKGLVEGGRGQAGSQGSQRVGRAIVAAQIAITFVLVIGAGLLGRSLMKVLEVNPGFRVDKIVAMDVSLPWTNCSCLRLMEWWLSAKNHATDTAMWAEVTRILVRVCIRMGWLASVSPNPSTVALFMTLHRKRSTAARSQLSEERALSPQRKAQRQKQCEPSLRSS